MKKIVKFGGSSLANAEQFQKVGEIIRSDESRRYVVPSAPERDLTEIQRLQIYFINVIILQLRGKISYRSFRRSREDIMRLSAD